MDLQIFVDLQDRLDQESTRNDSIRESVRELNKSCRLVSAKLSKAHSLSHQHTQEILTSAQPALTTTREHLQKLSQLITPVTFYRYHDMWTNAVKLACGLVVFSVYLGDSRLATPEDIQKKLGFPVNTKNEEITEFVITLEEYLHGVIALFGELSRLAVNSVIVNDIKRPQAISEFASDLYAGFQLLNLKNDSIRRSFDSIKYDIKKIEEVQYDLRVRGLTN